MKQNMGVHVLVNLYGCPSRLLEHSHVVLPLLDTIVKDANLTKVGESVHQFEPNGVTAVILLAQSHLSIHTWPEFGSAAVDIFCCADEEAAERAFQSLIQHFKPARFDKQIVKR